MLKQAVSKQTLIRKVILVKFDEKVLKFYCCDVDLIFQYGANYGNNFVARSEALKCSEVTNSMTLDPIWDEFGRILTQY